MTFVERQSDVDQVSDEKDEFLSHNVDFKTLEGLGGGGDGLERSDQAHSHHHDWENRYGIACHVHDEKIHGDSFDRPERDVP